MDSWRNLEEQNFLEDTKSRVVPQQQESNRKGFTVTSTKNGIKVQNQSYDQKEVVHNGNFKENEADTLLECDINENKILRKLPEKVPANRRLPGLFCRGKPCLLRLLLKGSLKSNAASLSLRKNVKGKNIRSAAHLCKILLSTKRHSKNTSNVNAKRKKSSKVYLKSPTKIFARIVEQHSHFSFDCSNNDDEENNASQLSADGKSNSSSRNFKRAILTPTRKINVTPPPTQQLELNEQTNNDIDIIIEGLFGGDYPNVIQLVFGAFCDCRETRSIAQMLLKSKPGKLSIAQIFLSRYLGIMDNAGNDIKKRSDCEKQQNFGSGFENEEISVKLCHRREPSWISSLSALSNHIEDIDIKLTQRLEELKSKSHAAIKLSEKYSKKMEGTSLVQSLFFIDDRVNRISLVKLLVLEEFDMKRKENLRWSIARLMLTPNPDSGDCVLDLLTSDDNIPVAQNVLRELVEGELEGNPSLARLAIEKRLIHFLLRGEEQGKKSLLRLLIQEFNGSQTPSIFFNKMHLKQILNNANASWYVDKLCKLGIALLQSKIELAPLTEFLYEAAVESLPVDDLCNSLGIDNSSGRGLKALIQSLKKSSLDFFSTQINQVSGVSVVFIVFTGLICGWRIRNKLYDSGANTSYSFHRDEILYEIRWWQRGLLKRSSLVAETVHRGTAWQVLLERCAISIQPEGKHGETFEAIVMTIAKEIDDSGNRIDILDRFQDILSIICLDEIDGKSFETNVLPAFFGELCQLYWKSEKIEDCRKICIETIRKAILQEFVKL